MLAPTPPQQSMTFTGTILGYQVERLPNGIYRGTMTFQPHGRHRHIDVSLTNPVAHYVQRAKLRPSQEITIRLTPLTSNRSTRAALAHFIELPRAASPTRPQEMAPAA